MTDVEPLPERVDRLERKIDANGERLENKLDADVGRLERRLDTNTRGLTRLESKLDRFLDQVNPLRQRRSRRVPKKR